MKTRITDGLQILAAILITGSVVAAAAPIPTETTDSKAPEAVKIVEADKDTQNESKAQETTKKQEPEPKLTWQDNPKKCDQNTHWIAKEAPYNCILKEKSASPAATSSKVVSVSGSCGDWIRAAGISDLANANELIRRESGCNPNAVNPTSGACGVAQELPCGKSGCSLGDGACQVKWMNTYVLARYGSWANAVGFHNRNNWY